MFSMGFFFFILEWRHGRGGHLILADEDLTTKGTNGWKRINTLAHYGIRESAVMCLVARRKDMLNCTRKLRFCIVQYKFTFIC